MTYRNSKGGGGGTDAKLVFHLEKILDEQQQSASNCSSSLSVDDLVRLLRLQYREYLRKDFSRTKQQVQIALQQMPKRKRRDHDEQEEDAYDAAAAEHDVIVAASSNHGGGLNAALRSQYKQVAERQSESLLGTVQEGEGMELPQGAVLGQVDTSSHLTTNNKSTTSTSTPTSNKKQRKKVRRLSSSVRSTTSGAGFGDPDSTSSNPPDFLTPVSTPPKERYSDLGGMDEVIQQIRQLVEYPLLRPELYRHLGVEPPRGVLLRGPPGTGKSHLANAVAGELQETVAYFRVSAPELVSGLSGESEGRIRLLFQTASRMAPAIIFLDELDAVAPKRKEENGRGMEKRMVAQLLTCMDMVAPKNNRNQAAVLVLAATNRPDSIDAALRRAGRFDREIQLGVPDEGTRERILRAMTKEMRLAGDFDYTVLAKKTPGYVGADVRSLANEAATLAINRIFYNFSQDKERSDDTVQEQESVKSDTATSDQQTSCDDDLPATATIRSVVPLSVQQMDPLYVTMEDFLSAIPFVQPSSKREGFATVPDVAWDDVGALQYIREELAISVLEPIKNPERFKALGLSLPAGVLLYGPPGCGKTLLAKAIANESGANFISVKGPELLDKYVGESERAVRLVFERARSSSPCIVFFDELDSLVPKRGSDNGGGGGVSERVVNQLLTELDGLDSRRSVFVIAATNRPELIDPAMLRPGRLDKTLYVPLPTKDDRVSILRALAVNVVLGKSVDIDAIAKSSRADGYSGADCAALLREAGLTVLKEASASSYSGQASEGTPLCIEMRHFDTAFNAVVPSVSRKDEARYNRLRDRMANARSRASAILDEKITGGMLDEEMDVKQSTELPFHEE